MAMLLSCGLFLLWSFIGLAVLRLGLQRWKLATLLFAPTLGIATLAVPTYILARFGVPTRVSGVPLVLAITAAAAIVLWRYRLSVQRARGLWRQGRLFVLLLIATLVLTGWPMFKYGFDWVANGNEDMANYCVIATGFRDHAYVAVPTLEELTAVSDGTTSFWFMYVLAQTRAGSEVTLALTSACTTLTTPQVFMPVILAFNAALVAATCGITMLNVGRRGALIAGALLAISGANTYGVVQQLIAQVGGLALLCVSLALVADRFRRLSRGLLIRRACACGMVFSGLLVFYPEVTPLLVLSCILIGVRDIVRRQLDWRYPAHAGVAILVMAALLPLYLWGAAYFLGLQTAHGTHQVDMKVEIFPYYMTPRGSALIWGFLPFSGPESGRFQSGTIVLGFILLLGVVVPTVRNVVRRSPHASALAVIGVLSVILYLQSDAFGLLKIALFAQPFLWAVVGTWVAQRKRWALAAVVPLVICVAALNARIQYWYVEQSRGKEYRVELAITNRHGMAEFRRSYAQHLAAQDVDRVLLATENCVLLKLLSAEIRGIPIEQGGVAMFNSLSASGFGHVEASPWVKVHPEWADYLRTLRHGYFTFERQRYQTPMRDPDTGAVLHFLLAPPIKYTNAPPQRVLVVAGGGSLSVLNRSRFPEAGPQIVSVPLSELQNFAIFTDASGARQQVTGRGVPKEIALYQLERDAWFPSNTMAGTGQAMVINVLNPTPKVRVVIHQTNSYHVEPEKRSVSPTHIIGDRRVPLGTIGMGSARLASPPLSPQAISDGHYLSIDFGPNKRRNPNQLNRMEQLWGSEIARDRRWLTGHARDISVISEEEYAAFKPPEVVNKFPHDLLNPQLEYSGFFEEGWVGTESKMRLAQPSPNHQCVIRGQVPDITGRNDFCPELTVLVDGVAAERRTLKPGDFTVHVAPQSGVGPHWVELRFSRSQILPEPDGRPLVAKITSIGFEPTNEAMSRPPEKLQAFPADLNHPKLEQSGIYLDGWGEKAFRALLSQTAPGNEVVVRGMVPEVSGNAAFLTEMTVLIDGTEAVRRKLGPGDFEVRLPGGKTAQARWVECRFSHTQQLPPPDGRNVSAHIRFFGFEPPRPTP